jgi:thiamine transporter
MFPFLTGALADEAGEVVENVTEAVTDAAEQVAETVQQAASEAPSWLHDAISKFGKTPMEAWITLGTLVVIGLVLMAVSKSSKKWTAKTIAFGALSVALSFVLSCIRLFRMPNGGSVTPASMLPIMLFAAANGVGPGFLTGIVYGILQCLQGGGIMAAGGFAQFALDYLLAFTVLGLAGFAKKLPKGWGLYLAIAIAALARMLCHTLAGVLFWDTAPWASFVYNISYLGPDTLICMVLALAIAKPVMKIMKAQ